MHNGKHTGANYAAVASGGTQSVVEMGLAGGGPHKAFDPRGQNSHGVKLWLHRHVPCLASTQTQEAKLITKEAWSPYRHRMSLADCLVS